MTIQKIEIITTIASQKPESVYELAKLVDRDFGAVYRDCVSLEASGFIKLKDLKDAKSKKKPLLKFNYKGIAVFLPSAPYQIAFSKVA